MKTYFIRTFGCQMNAYDSELLEGHFSKAGLRRAESFEEADVILVNTCSVRQHAEDRALAWIREAGARKKPGALLVLAGCMAERIGEELLEKIPSLDRIIGPNQYGRLLELLAPDCAVFTGNESKDLSRLGGSKTSRHGVSASIAIMRGCNNYCSYCIVPYVRGPERSRSSVEIVEETRLLIASGVREVVLLGQNVNSYHDGGCDFAGLIQGIDALPGEFRIGFMTSHPKDLSDRLISTLAGCAKVNRHLHLPAQSGSDAVLARMGRGYTSGHYRDLVRKVRCAVPGISITTDLMVGFPGEMPEDFQQTLQLAREIGFDEAFTYQYSVRPGTRAAEFPDDVPLSEKKRRLTGLIRLQRDMTREKYRAMIGKTFYVLFEKPSGRNRNQWWGRTEFGRPFVATDNRIVPGVTARVRAVSTTGATLIGELVAKEEVLCGF